MAKFIRFFAALALLAFTNAQPVITELGPSTQALSRHLKIAGNGFGTTRGTVTVGGLDAITTTWTDTKIFAYVPEGSSLGTQTVQVNTGTGTAQTSVNVVARSSSGRFLWDKLRMDASYSFVKPAVGTDGTVYAVDLAGTLYAIGSDGSLKWVMTDTGAKACSLIPAASSHTQTDLIITGTDTEGVKLINTVDQSILWTFDWIYAVLLDVKWNPEDGNIYGVTYNDPGVFSLNPQDGTMRSGWPFYYKRPKFFESYAPMAFGPNRVWVWSGEVNNAYLALGFDLQGNLMAQIPLNAQMCVNPSTSNVHFSNSVYDENGNFVCQYSTFLNSEPACGSNGITYSSTAMNPAIAVGMDGSCGTDWTKSVEQVHTANFVNTPTTNLLRFHVTTLNFPGVLHSTSPASGADQFRIEFPVESPEITNYATGSCGVNHAYDSPGAFDGDTMYLQTFTASPDSATYMHALSIASGVSHPPTILRSKSVTLSSSSRKGVLTVTGTVSVEDDNLNSVSDAVVRVRWTLPDGSTVDQPTRRNLKGKPGGGGGGGGGGGSFSVQGSAGSYRLDVIGLEKAGYTADLCNGSKFAVGYFF